MKKLSIYIILSIFALAALGLYALTLRGEFGNAENPRAGGYQTQAGGVFESSHERAPYAFMRSLLQSHSVAISKELADFSSPDAGFVKDKFYSFFPVGISALIMPLYILGSQFNAGVLGAYATMPLVGFFVICLLFVISRQVLKLSFWTSIASAFIFAFATTSWSYSITIYQHIASTAAVLLGFYSVWKYTQRGKGAWLWAALFGFVYAGSVFIDYPNALLLAPLGVYFVCASFDVTKTIEKTRIGLRSGFFAMLLVFVVLTGLHLYYNQTQLGSWKKFHNTFPRYTTETYAASYNGSVDEAKRKENVSRIFKETNLVSGAYELFVAPDKGIFFFSPILLLALLGMYYSLKKPNGAVVTLFFLVVTNFFVYGSFGDPWGGWAYGPRYVIPAMACMALFVGIALQQVRYKYLTRFIALTLTLYSAAIALLGAVTSNLVPPKVEADYFHLKYNFLRNIDFLRSGVSENFIYTHYLRTHMSLESYFFVLFAAVAALFIIIFCVLPFVKEDNHA